MCVDSLKTRKNFIIKFLHSISAAKRKYQIEQTNVQSRETGNKVYTRRRKPSKNTTQYMLDSAMRKPTQIT